MSAVVRDEATEHARLMAASWDAQARALDLTAEASQYRPGKTLLERQHLAEQYRKHAEDARSTARVYSTATGAVAAPQPSVTIGLAMTRDRIRADLSDLDVVASEHFGIGWMTSARQDGRASAEEAAQAIAQIKAWGQAKRAELKASAVAPCGRAA